MIKTKEKRNEKKGNEKSNEKRKIKMRVSREFRVYLQSKPPGDKH